MKRVTIILGTLAVVMATAVIACNSSSGKSTNNEGLVTATTNNDNLVHRGQYLVTIMGCHDCHSPKKMGPHGPELDSSRLLSGHPAGIPLAQVDPKELQSWVLFSHTATAFVGPWGTSFAANITADETGIGTWTEAQFFKAMRQGKYKGLDNSRPLLPPMPWQVYAQATDEDLKAIFAYLKSTTPVKNVVPAPRSLQEVAKL